MMQLICIIFSLSLILHKTIQQDGGRNDGEPDYVSDGFLVEMREGEGINGDTNHELISPEDTEFEEKDELEEKGKYKYLMLMPENLEDSSDFEIRGGNDDNDMVEVPDNVWNSERNGSTVNLTLRQPHRHPESPPSTACLSIKLIYNQGWVQSSAGGNTALARQRALDVLSEAESVYNTKFSSCKQLGTRIKFNVVGEGPVYDSSGSYQATGESLSSSAIQRWVDTSSQSTQHYAFLTGNNVEGPIGIAYVGTACFRNSNDQRYKISINEWYNDVAQSGKVLAHEIGHALGMTHDFGNGGTSDIRYDTSGDRCTGINGLMDYGARTRVNKFSRCSREDFASWYRRVLTTYGSFCLTCKDTYRVAGKNENCYDKQVIFMINGIIKTESECIVAAAQLGLKYQNDLRANYRPLGCFTWLDGSRYTYFNTLIDSSSTSSTSITAGICKTGGCEDISKQQRGTESRCDWYKRIWPQYCRSNSYVKYICRKTCGLCDTSTRYSVISSNKFCEHVQGGYPARCLRYDSKCKEKCTEFDWCIGYSFSNPICYLMTSTGSCSTGWTFFPGYIARQKSELRPRSSNGYNCIAKDPYTTRSDV